MKIETVVITPELAKKWLSLNTNNRPLRSGVVNKYADDMIAGRWKLNGETIKLNGDRLIDGQHRLKACVSSGVPFVSLVVHGVDSDTFDTIDRGMVRSFGQILSIAGRKNATLIASAARVLWYLESGREYTGGGEISVGELEEVLARYPEIDEYASKTAGTHMVRQLLPAGIACALWMLFARKDAEIADSFFSDLNDGMNYYQPIMKLRQRLISDRMSKKRQIMRNEMLAITIKAWNAVRENRTISVLKWVKTEDKTESRPLIK